MKKKKTIGKLKADLDKVFNRYIRFRDCDGGYGVCISCGKGNSFDYMDAGHFFAKKGYDGLRYNEDNVHAECRGCNRYDESHLIGYAENLVHRIGESDYDSLKQEAKLYKQCGFKWDRTTIEELIIKYKNYLKDYE